MNPTAWNRTAWTIGLILFFAGLYVAGYAANLHPGLHYCASPVDGALMKRATFRVGGTGAEAFFWPVFQADLHLRPERWPEPPLLMCSVPECP